MPEGDRSQMPAMPKFTTGWRLGTPDLVLEMPKEFEVPASRPDIFRNFVVPSGLLEDKWVRAVEFRPSARAVVHHALFAYVHAGAYASIDGTDGQPGFRGLAPIGANPAISPAGPLGGWAVGATPRFLPRRAGAADGARVGLRDQDAPPSDGQSRARKNLFQRATKEMDSAVGIAPDDIRVRMAPGVVLRMLTPTMPRFGNVPGLIENARVDHQRMFDLQQSQLDKLSAHSLGELLQGLAELNSRQGKTADAEKYYGMIQSMLKGTDYTARAAEWMKTKQPLPQAQTNCVGCHLN
jgi:hypothetical protein